MAPHHSDFTPDQLRALDCWFDADRVARDRETTTWKRRARLGQARWRAALDLPCGAEPYAGGAGSTPVGSRLALDFARSSGANFLTAAARAAVKARLGAPEPHQMLSEPRLQADLLSSMPLCFNLFGDLAADGALAERATRAWFPDAPQGAVHVRFEHSPGRRDPTFLRNCSAFDVALETESGSARAIVGVETKYHEHAKLEDVPGEAALRRYAEVTDRSGAFRPCWRNHLVGTALQQIWLDHLLVLSMLQHPSGAWTWGRFVLAYPAENPSFAAAASRYAEVLRDSSTFLARTIESMVATPGALPEETVALFRGRYFAPTCSETRPHATV